MPLNENSQRFVGRYSSSQRTRRNFIRDPDDVNIRGRIRDQNSLPMYSQSPGLVLRQLRSNMNYNLGQISNSENLGVANNYTPLKNEYFGNLTPDRVNNVYIRLIEDGVIPDLPRDPDTDNARQRATRGVITLVNTAENLDELSLRGNIRGACDALQRFASGSDEAELAALYEVENQGANVLTIASRFATMVRRNAANSLDDVVRRMIDDEIDTRNRAPYDGGRTRARLLTEAYLQYERQQAEEEEQAQADAA